jgi:hypothetical protein
MDELGKDLERSSRGMMEIRERETVNESQMEVKQL